MTKGKKELGVIKVERERERKLRGRKRRSAKFHYCFHCDLNYLVIIIISTYFYILW